METLSCEEIANLTRYKPLENCGVYFLFLDNKIVYIGSSIDVYVRTYNHIGKKEFDSFTFIKTTPEDRYRLEEEYIGKFMPEGNKSFISDSYKSEEWIRKRLKACNRRDITNNLRVLIREKKIKRHESFQDLISVIDFNEKFNIDLYSINIDNRVLKNK
jgi:hypothetical protein